jgi:diguanylate cyclase (GGDEF)-like protein
VTQYSLRKLTNVTRTIKIASRYPKSIIKVSYGMMITVCVVLAGWGITQLYQQELVDQQQEIDVKALGVDAMLKTTLNNVDLLRSQAEYLLSKRQLVISNDDVARANYWFTTATHQNSYSFDYAPSKLFPGGKDFNLFALHDTDVKKVSPFFHRGKGVNFRREVEMSLSLAPLLRPIHQQLPTGGSVHYTSLAALGMTYPLTPPMTRKVRIDTFKKAINQEFISGTITKNHYNHKTYFTRPYQDNFGRGLMVTASSAVFHEDKHIGNVGIDVSLQALNRFVKKLGGKGTIILNSEGQVLSHPTLQSHVTSITSVQQLIKNVNIQTKLRTLLKTQKKGQISTDGYVITYQKLNNAGWIIVNIIPINAFLQDILIKQLPIILGVIVSMTGLLLISLKIMNGVFERSNQARIAAESANKKLQRALTELELLASTDKLTGAWNRRHFEQVVSAEINRFGRHCQELSLLILDIDYFKSINDNYGHHVGDIVLSKTSYLIKENIRESDILARWGGEEFVILAPSTSISKAVELAERLRLIIASQTFPECGNITVSFGVAQFQTSENLYKCLKRADDALYHAKNSGRNTVAAAPSIFGVYQLTNTSEPTLKSFI